MPRYIDSDWIYEKVENRYRVSSGIEHRCERDLLNLICEAPTADVVPRSEEGAECPTCYGTGRIGTTNWLTKNMTKKQIAEEKAKAIAEHEQHIKNEYARKIFEEIEKALNLSKCYCESGIYFEHDIEADIAELKKKYIGEQE